MALFLRRPRAGFRFKLFVALALPTAVLAAVLLVFARRETARQIVAAIEDASQRTDRRFGELEGLWAKNLAGLSGRLTSSTRIPGAMEAALEELDPRVLADATAYELTLAGIRGVVAAFFNANSVPVLTLLDGGSIPWEGPAAQPGDATGRQLSYRLLRGSLYAFYTRPVELFGRRLGLLAVGLPIREEIARGFESLVGAEVAFVAGGTVAAASPGMAGSDLGERVVALAAGPARAEVFAGGGEWAISTRRLGDDAAFRVIAIPIAAVVAPYRRLERTILGGGLVALVLALLVGNVLSGSLAAPVRSLEQAARTVARGDYTIRVAVTTNDEIGELGRAFNEMARDLGLKEQYRSLLNKVVSPDVAAEMLAGEIFLGGENRVATILFADIRGFTSLSEGMEPQEVISILNAYMEGAAGAVEQEGGVVDKYVGDELMAVFGAPVAHVDDAARAARAAWRIREFALRISAERAAAGKRTVELGIGINTGLVVAGNMGSSNRLNYTVLGEAVNLAARLCAVAGRGQILLSEAAFAATAGRVAAAVQPPLQLKGFSSTVIPYLLTGVETDANA